MDLALYIGTRNLAPDFNFRGMIYRDTASLREIIEHRMTKADAVALSGGMDSAILANYTKGPAYTLVYPGDTAEAAQAKRYTDDLRLVHVDRAAYFRAYEELIGKLKRPVVPHAPLLYLIAKRAKADGCKSLACGVGAGAHGGWPKLWAEPGRKAFQRAVQRLFFDPQTVLLRAPKIDWVFDRFSDGSVVDVQEYLQVVGTEGRSVEHSIEAAGVMAVMPYHKCRWVGKYNRDDICDGRGKPHIRELYSLIYSEAPPKKHALPAPYEQWSKGYKPSNKAFRKGFKVSPGKRACMIWGVEKYMEMFV